MMVRDKKRNQFLLLTLLLCALPSMACFTLTIGTEVLLPANGKSMVASQMRMEFDREVYRAMQEYSPSSSSPSNALPGWRVVESDGGRIVDIIMDSTPLEGLAGKSWVVTEQAGSNGRIRVAKLKLDNSGDPRAQALLYTITFDERDPNLIRYSFDASAQVTKESGGNPIPPDSNDPVKNAKWQKLDNAIKAAGPGKMIFVMTLPGTIEKTNGSARGNQISWTLSMDKPGTYTMSASSSAKPGATGTQPQPLQTRSSLQPPPRTLLKGDCDGDGKSTELDALCALEMSTRIRAVNLTMDVDNSGDVSSRDAVLILQRAIGK